MDFSVILPMLAHDSSRQNQTSETSSLRRDVRSR